MVRPSKATNAPTRSPSANPARTRPSTPVMWQFELVPQSSDRTLAATTRARTVPRNPPTKAPARIHVRKDALVESGIVRIAIVAHHLAEAGGHGRTLVPL